MQTDPGQPNERRSVREQFRTAMISGLAITVPILVTLFVFNFAMNLLLDSVGPLAELLRMLGIDGGLAPDVAALVTLLVIVFVVGFATERSRASRRIEAAFNRTVSAIPGIGAVYSSFNEMSSLLLDSEVRSFREVKLVEYPVEGSYCVAFVTAETSQNIRNAAGINGMTTLYLPMAPNPVMGGFVVHVDDEKVYDVDMTVEEGMRSLVTSGVAINNAEDVPVEEIPGSGDRPIVEHVSEPDADSGSG
ncbi:DUF502 domain-containing protein [Halapricum hydrolyticum]|uniref:DUF502 domain-containing protein n=1 Tax=Halapricum hydrolyticum TaxID=2979991 RepID=A0AAE3ID20_9EURY|nr:DUF502 domain-containing protein [Halapricum hydrolyticum]MCU4719217.1 DUF502 domain-containing protein [Halapricum hydrolyticum]MCU4728350.1 DUF502 domain-containing protein [Halapricum hydrolyticum]